MLNRNRSQIKVYEPNHILRAGIRVWPEMIRELIDSRGLVWRFVVRDFSARYRQSVLGLLWAFMLPLSIMLVFVWVKQKNLLPIKETFMPYAAFVFSGQMVWLIFSQGITASAASIVSAGSLLGKINFPREVLVFSAVSQTIIDFAIRVPLLFIIFFWVDYRPSPGILAVPLLLIPLLMLVAGLGFFVSLLNAVLRDMGSVLGIVLNLGMFVTPVVYPPPSTWPLNFFINTLNPVSGFVAAARDMTTLGSLSNPEGYIFSCLVSLLVFMLGWRLFHIVEPILAERV